MKHIIIILLLLLSKFCYSQDLQHADSMSRAKADIVLSHFDSVNVSKLLYSIEDKYYYVLLNEHPLLKEYVVETDSLGNIVNVKLIIENANTKKQRKLAKKDKKLLKELAIFDLAKYNSGYITENSNAMYFTFGRMSYFVIKDNIGNRYGEFRFVMPVKPAPIDLNLWAYMIRKISEQ
jgi:hypothetical protein